MKLQYALKQWNEGQAEASHHLTISMRPKTVPQSMILPIRPRPDPETQEEAIAQLRSILASSDIPRFQPPTDRPGSDTPASQAEETPSTSGIATPRTGATGTTTGTPMFTPRSEDPFDEAEYDEMVEDAARRDAWKYGREWMRKHELVGRENAAPIDFDYALEQRLACTARLCADSEQAASAYREIMQVQDDSKLSASAKPLAEDIRDNGIDGSLVGKSLVWLKNKFEDYQSQEGPLNLKDDLLFHVLTSAGIARKGVMDSCLDLHKQVFWAGISGGEPVVEASTAGAETIPEIEAVTIVSDLFGCKCWDWNRGESLATSTLGTRSRPLSWMTGSGSATPTTPTPKRPRGGESTSPGSSATA